MKIIQRQICQSFALPPLPDKGTSQTRLLQHVMHIEGQLKYALKMNTGITSWRIRTMKKSGFPLG